MKTDVNYNAILEHIEAVCIDDREFPCKEYALMLANKRNYSDPNCKVPMTDADFLREVLKTEAINDAILKDPTIIESEKIEVVDEKLIKGSSLYISFHYSLFRIIPFIFVEREVPLVVIGGSPELFRHHYFGTYLETLTIDNPFLLIEVDNHLNAGKSVLIYIDADWGTRHEDNKYLSCAFGDGSIDLRNSIFRFAARTKCDTHVIVANESTDMSFHINIFEKLSHNLPEDEFVSALGSHVAKMLETCIVKSPQSWTQWAGVHKMLSRSSRITSSPTRPITKLQLYLFLLFDSNTPLMFNSELYILFRDENRFCILNTISYEACSVSELLYLSLKSATCTVKELKKLIPPCELAYAITHRILIKKR